MKYIRQILVVIATLGSLLSLEMGIAQTTQSTEATNAETAYTCLLYTSDAADE